MTDIVGEITKQRGQVYGPFMDNAALAQEIKDAMRRHSGWSQLPMDARESLDMIAYKIARIVTGSWQHVDNWDDIGGYARLVADRLRR